MQKLVTQIEMLKVVLHLVRRRRGRELSIKTWKPGDRFGIRYTLVDSDGFELSRSLSRTEIYECLYTLTLTLHRMKSKELKQEQQEQQQQEVKL